MGVAIGLVALLSCKQQINPLAATSDCALMPLEKAIIGRWNYASNFSGEDGQGGTHFKGTITFNSDGTVTDPDLLLGKIYHGQAISKKWFTATSDTLAFFWATPQETAFFKGVNQVAICGQLVFTPWVYYTPATSVKLTLTK